MEWIILDQIKTEPSIKTNKRTSGLKQNYHCPEGIMRGALKT